MSSEPVGLDIEVAGSETIVITVRGEVDISTCDQFRAAVEEAVAAQPPGGIVLLLGDVGFIDSSGLAVMINAENSGVPVHVRESSPAVRVAIAATGLQHFLESES